MWSHANNSWLNANDQWSITRKQTKSIFSETEILFFCLHGPGNLSCSIQSNNYEDNGGRKFLIALIHVISHKSMLSSYRKKPLNLQSISNDWFLYDGKTGLKSLSSLYTKLNQLTTSAPEGETDCLLWHSYLSYY